MHRDLGVLPFLLKSITIEPTAKPTNQSTNLLYSPFIHPQNSRVIRKLLKVTGARGERERRQYSALWFSPTLATVVWPETEEYWRLEVIQSKEKTQFQPFFFSVDRECCNFVLFFLLPITKHSFNVNIKLVARRDVCFHVVQREHDGNDDVTGTLLNGKHKCLPLTERNKTFTVSSVVTEVQSYLYSVYKYFL